MFCPKCGKEIESNTAICPHCGYDYSSDVAEQNQSDKQSNSKNSRSFEWNNKYSALVLIVGLILAIGIGLAVRHAKQNSADTDGVIDTETTDTGSEGSETVVSSEDDGSEDDSFGDNDDDTDEDDGEVSGDKEDSEEADITNNEDWQEDDVLPNSSDEYLSRSDVEALSDQELRIAINEIYARHHYQFQTPEMRDYFSNKDWYTGNNPDQAQVRNTFNDVEEANMKIMESVRESRKE